MTHQYETRDINPRVLGIIGLMLIATLILSTVATLFLYRAFSLRTQTIEGPISPPMAKTEVPFPNPQLQIYPPDELLKLQQESAAILNNYRWVDRKAGVVGIPIERAMDLVASEGKHPVLGTPGLPQGPTWVDLMQRRAETAADKESKP